MKFFKNNFKLIIGFVVGVILAGGIVYAATSASEVSYTTDKNAEIKTVAEALNDLYLKSQTYNSTLTFGTTQYSSKQEKTVANNTTNLSLSKGKYIISAVFSDGDAYGNVKDDYSTNNLTKITLTSDSDCIIQQISELDAFGSGSTKWNNIYLTTSFTNSLYYVTVNSNNATVTVNYVDTANYYKGATINLTAVPIL